MTPPLQPPPAPVKPRFGLAARIGMVVGVFALLAVVATAVNNYRVPGTPSAVPGTPTTVPSAGAGQTVPWPPIVNPPAAPSVLVNAIPEGVWFIGKDVQPGTYRSTGAREVNGWCYWARHRSADGGWMDGIIASDGNRGPGQMVVTIAASDVLFRTRGCAPFVKVS